MMLQFMLLNILATNDEVEFLQSDRGRKAVRTREVNIHFY